MAAADESNCINALAAEPLVISIIEAAALKAFNEVDTPHLRVAGFFTAIAPLRYSYSRA